MWKAMPNVRPGRAGSSHRLMNLATVKHCSVSGMDSRTRGMSSFDGGRVSPRRSLLIAGVSAAIVGLALASTAVADQDPLKGGSVVMQLSGGKGLKVRPHSLTLPITGGQLDPVTGAGNVVAAGSFKAKKGRSKAKVTITSLTFGANGGPGAIAAKVGKKNVSNFGALSGGTVARAGFGATISNVNATITSKGLKALSGKGGGHKSAAAAKAIPLGTVSATTVPKTVEVLPGGTMVLKTDPGLVTKLLAHCIDGLPTASPPGASPIAPATEDLMGAFTFPVSGGSAAPDLSEGEVITAGGQKIAKNNTILVTTMFPACSTQPPPVGTNLLQNDFRSAFDRKTLSANVTLPGGSFIGLAAAGNINFGPAGLNFNPNNKQISFTNAPVTFTQLSADTLNQYFPNVSGNPSNDFKAGDLLGTLSLSGATLR
jgi:hypothetical protein